MKRKFFPAIFALVVTLLVSCAKYTDITPKGQTLLNKATDLDLLLNVDFGGTAFNYITQGMLINDNYPEVANVPNIINGVQSLGKIILTYDEAGDRIGLTPTDSRYEGLYGIITKTSNIVIINGDGASGDPELIKRLKAEAYILRAFLHYRLVNIYAQAYDPATAATDGGIPYVTDIVFEKLNEKKTMREVYDNLLADVESALALNSLPDNPVNSMRVGKGFAYAVKAQILISMRNYAGALEAVNESLKYNSTLEDHRPYLASPRSARELIRNGLTAPDNVFYAFGSDIDPTLRNASVEAFAMYEPGSIVKDETDSYNLDFGALYSGVPGSPLFLAVSYQGNSAGLTTSDLTLIKAECLIRTGKTAEGMAEIEKIRVRRIDPAVYVALTATTESQAMAQLQKVSRIELLFTIRNFINIKRWNKEDKYPITITRTIDGKTYTLKPDSKLWVFPFPQSATLFNETLSQNF